MDNAVPDEAIYLNIAILKRQKFVRCVQFTGQRAISATKHCLALEYIANCRSGVSFIAFGCLDGHILVQKFTKFDCVCTATCAR